MVHGKGINSSSSCATICWKNDPFFWNCFGSLLKVNWPWLFLGFLHGVNYILCESRQFISLQSEWFLFLNPVGKARTCNTVLNRSGEGRRSLVLNIPLKAFKLFTIMMLAVGFLYMFFSRLRKKRFFVMFKLKFGLFHDQYLFPLKFSRIAFVCHLYFVKSFILETYFETLGPDR